MPHQDDRDRIYNEKGVAADMLDFLHAFFEGGCYVWALFCWLTSHAGHLCKGALRMGSSTLALLCAAHPELVDNPLYITGESYGGHYVSGLPSFIAVHCHSRQLQSALLRRLSMHGVKIRCLAGTLLCLHQSLRVCMEACLHQ